jgi:hypothetical protein
MDVLVDVCAAERPRQVVNRTACLAFCRSTGFMVGSIDMMNSTNRFASPSARMTAKAILFASAFTLLAGCVETPPPRPYHAYREVPPPPPRPNTEVYAYPQQGQTPEQTDRDRYDCHEWAVKQSNFDPSAPGVPPHDQVRVASGPPPGTNTAIGAVAGAILGAVIAGPRDSGFGAVAGGITGAAIGSTGDAANAEAQRQQIQAVRAQDARQAAILDQKASNYRRAISACLEGRGYSVK